MGNYSCLSHIICKDTPSYGNRDQIIIKSNTSIKNGDSANSSSWTFSNNHIGTHIDVPRHFDDEGLKTMDIPIQDFFFNKISLVDIPCSEARLIDETDFMRVLKSIVKDTELLLIRTGFEQFRNEERYWNANPGLAPALAGFFHDNFPFLRCVGFDFISLTSWLHRDMGRKSHKAFLCPDNKAKALMVIEDMALAKAPYSLQHVIVAPIFVEDGNGGAVTIFAEI